MQVIKEISEIKSIEKWFIVDIGYSNGQNSCGVLTIENDRCSLQDITFSQLQQLFKDFYSGNKNTKTGLVLEAPLSILFDEKGNPLGRVFEKEEETISKDGKEKILIKSTRYWYYGAGATVTLGALEFLNRVIDILINNNIYLFEGFVSFKKESEKEERKKEKHFYDAKLLFDGIEYIKENIKCKQEINQKYIFIGNYLEDIKMVGIPPIIKVSQDKKEIFMIKS